MTTSREKLEEDRINQIQEALHPDLSLAFGEETEDNTPPGIIDSALYILTGEDYESSTYTWFLDWQNGRWHVSYQSRTHDYQDEKIDEIIQTINSNYRALK